MYDGEWRGCPIVFSELDYSSMSVAVSCAEMRHGIAKIMCKGVAHLRECACIHRLAAMTGRMTNSMELGIRRGATGGASLVLLDWGWHLSSNPD